MKGQRLFCNEIAQRMLEPIVVQPVDDKIHTLSRREREVFRLMLEGLQNREIADQLNVCRRTVEKHKERVARKLGVRNTLGLVMAGLRMGLVGLPPMA
jgi:DNA-binding NarL/FixJ family response regulator